MPTSLACPKCKHAMENIQRPGADYFRCTNCSGLWFKMGDYKRLENVAELVDIGEVKLGEQFNKIDRIDCPQCKQPLIRMVDAKQPHIWYESCKQCYGRFYDAGEFRDLAEYSFSDYIKQFSVEARD